MPCQSTMSQLVRVTPRTPQPAEVTPPSPRALTNRMFTSRDYYSVFAWLKTDSHRKDFTTFRWEENEKNHPAVFKRCCGNQNNTIFNSD